jgi:LysM repeat protein
MHRHHHRVRKGDSLYRISRRYGVPVIFLINLNPHLRSRPHRIHVGERVRVR